MLSFVDVVFRELAEQRFLQTVRSSKTLNISIAFGKPLPLEHVSIERTMRVMYFRIQSFEVTP